jgi:NAD(P)H-hydrate epimerase
MALIDGLFGFSFHGEPRAPFDQLLEILKPYNSPPPIVSIDIPSGWSVDEGDVEGTGIRPELLVGWCKLISVC